MHPSTTSYRNDRCALGGFLKDMMFRKHTFPLERRPYVQACLKRFISTCANRRLVDLFSNCIVSAQNHRCQQSNIAIAAKGLRKCKFSSSILPDALVMLVSGTQSLLIGIIALAAAVANKTPLVWRPTPRSTQVRNSDVPLIHGELLYCRSVQHYSSIRP